MGDSIGTAAARAATTTRVDGGALVGRILGEQGVRYCFTVNGGHIWPILSHLREHGVQMIHMRHEQSCAYAADAYARTSGTPGRARASRRAAGSPTPSPGLCVAGLAGSPVVCLAGQHPTTEDYLGSFQEAYGSEICRTFSKFTKRVLDWSTIEVDLRHGVPRGDGPAARARAARDPDQHPLPAGRRRAAAPRRAQSIRPTRCAAPGDPGGDRARARGRSRAPSGRSSSPATASSGPTPRPSCARSPSACRFPVYTRRAGQGAVPEDDPLAVRGAWKKPFTGRADVVLAVGFRFWSGEHFGEPPTWNADATYIQVDADAVAHRLARAGRQSPSSAIRSSCCAQLVDARRRARRRRRAARATARGSPRSATCAPSSTARSHAQEAEVHDATPDPSRRASCATCSR